MTTRIADLLDDAGLAISVRTWLRPFLDLHGYLAQEGYYPDE